MPQELENEKLKAQIDDLRSSIKARSSYWPIILTGLISTLASTLLFYLQTKDRNTRIDQAIIQIDKDRLEVGQIFLAKEANAECTPIAMVRKGEKYRVWNEGNVFVVTEGEGFKRTMTVDQRTSQDFIAGWGDDTTPSQLSVCRPKRQNGEVWTLKGTFKPLR